jgi:hypothetical protein
VSSSKSYNEGEEEEDSPRMPRRTAPLLEENDPLSFSQISCNPTFRYATLNAVAVIPLLSHKNSNKNRSGDINHNCMEDETNNDVSSASTLSCRELWAALRQHFGGSSSDTSSSTSSNSSSNIEDDLILVIPNGSLTRPGDWKYDDTPLKSFHWQHGCQRLLLFDGRPDSHHHHHHGNHHHHHHHHHRMAHDRLMNYGLTRDWIDLCPHRRTAAVIGILNVKDCHSTSDLHRAEDELHQWTQRYATPSYEVSTLGRNFDRDMPISRLFVYDSFDESCQHINLSQCKLSQDQLLALPPMDPTTTSPEMMKLHLSLVMNDVVVAVFRSLEDMIRRSDDIGKSIATTAALSMSGTIPMMGGVGGGGMNISSGTRITSLGRRLAGTTSSIPSSSTTTSTANATASAVDEPLATNTKLSLGNIVNLVSPDSKLAKEMVEPKDDHGETEPPALDLVRKASGSGTGSSIEAMMKAAYKNSVKSSTTIPLPASPKKSSSSGAIGGGIVIDYKFQATPQLLTPLDSILDMTELSMKDAEAFRKRDIGRREKFAADLALLAGSPLDAYERYLKAAENGRNFGTPDPLWYAFALIGCATAHIAMADVGGYGVDEYLDNNFQYPEEIMALALNPSVLTRKEVSDGSKTVRSQNKQTLPEVVFTLCDEALNILRRHPKLAPFHAELLLQLAHYASDASEQHLRCVWGDGIGCFKGTELDETATPRWERTTVSKLRFPSSLKVKDTGDNMIIINTFNRLKKFCQLLQQAVSVGPLFPASRVDVAMHCIRACLKGVKVCPFQTTTVSYDLSFDICLRVLR